MFTLLVLPCHFQGAAAQSKGLPMFLLGDILNKGTVKMQVKSHCVYMVGKDICMHGWMDGGMSGGSVVEIGLRCLR